MKTDQLLDAKGLACPMHTNLKELKAYSGTYVGDNSDVSAIVRLLPGGETMGELDLTGEKLHVTYDDGAKSISESAFQTL